MNAPAPKETIERLNKLKKAIEKHRYNYHVLDKQEISEPALDSLKRELVQIESQYPDLVTPDSPSRRVGGQPLPEFKKVRHAVPQWSFNDAFTAEEMREFDARVKRFLSQAGVKDPRPTYTCEHKIDGLKIVLTYENGALKQAATRGDGVIGEDVTENVKTIESVPLRLGSANLGSSPAIGLADRIPSLLIVEGEAWIAKSTLEKLNAARKKRAEEPFANPRNLAAGSIRQLNPKIAAERHLDSFIYDIASMNASATGAALNKTRESSKEFSFPATQREELEFLKSLGFKVNKHYKRCGNIEEIIQYWQEWRKKMPKEDYWADGIVVKVDEREYQELLGYTGKAPRWGIAFKFPGKEVTTILEDIVFQVGRMGTVTPVAALKPVSIGGSVVSRATLHNEDEIKRRDARIGDTVILRKAGDVIPEIVSVVKEMRRADSRPFVWPNHIPACGGSGKIERIPGEAAWRCVNRDSFEQQKRKFHYFTSKKCFDIDGLGPKILDLLIENGLVAAFDDIFTLKKGDLLNLPRFAEKSADNLVQAIEKARKITLSRFLTSLSIPQVGEETAYDIARHFQGRVPEKASGNLALELIAKAKKEAVELIYGAGPVVARAVFLWFSNADNKKLLRNLLKHVTLIQEETGGTKPFQGQSFVFTGALPTLSREDARALARKNGGDISGSVSKNTSFVVAGEEAGSKLDKAKGLGVKIISEDEFLKMVRK
jgi:DNA ligase (NAD+)